MSDLVVVLNAGSSSIKFSVFDIEDEALHLVYRGQAEGIHTAPRFIVNDAEGKQVEEKIWHEHERPGIDGALAYLVEFLRSNIEQYSSLAIGHRVVHGGVEFTHPTLMDLDTVERLEKLIPLAPLHQPYNLSPIRRLLERMPELPQVACFDTAFHANQPKLAYLMALPQDLIKAGVRRYGFHGLSYEYITSVLPSYDSRAAKGRTVIMHLGNGASMCAVKDCRSMASTTGFTAAGGLPMGTRSGAMDAGVALFLIEYCGMTPQAVQELIYKQSGLLGLSGVSSDMRALEASQDPNAKLAIDFYIYRIGRELGSMTAALGGLDSIVFTAGIGENAVDLRQRVCRDAAWLGVEFDEAANATHGPRISAKDSPVSVWVIPTNEEFMIARHTLRTIAQA